ncbi:MAG: hypothetical protein KF858_05350 [Candidatus Sumerlaeia bacterium]|nr:hypothetical protein [Candidatus Sumerlaeia bacterium]
MRATHPWPVGLLALTIFGAAVAPAQVSIFDYYVTTLVDENDAEPEMGTGESLREILAIAPDGAMIYFAPGLLPGTMQLVHGSLPIGGNVTIDGITPESPVIPEPFKSGIAQPRATIDPYNPATLTIVGTGTQAVFNVLEDGVGVLRNLNLTNPSSGYTSDGGGIINHGTLTLDSVSIYDSAALRGGGVLNLGSLLMVNSTLSNNATRFNGGGLYSQSGSATVINSTIVENGCGMLEDDGVEGGGVYVATGAITMHNTIVASNFVTPPLETSVEDFSHDFAGTLQSVSSHNIISDGTGMFGITDAMSGNQVGTTVEPIDVRLLPLDLAGGVTRTHALVVGSPAIDAGNNSVVNDTFFPAGAPFLDQRASPRISGSIVDIGAYEGGDYDGDGVPDVVENGIENYIGGNFKSILYGHGDGNGDGTLDSVQSTVASLPDAVTGEYAYIESLDGFALENVSAVANPRPGNYPQSNFPNGFFKYDLVGVPSGGDAFVWIAYYSPLSFDRVWNYGPRPDEIVVGKSGPELYGFLFDLHDPVGASVSPPSSLYVVYTDGELGDHDLTANGIITTMIAPGVESPTLVQLVSFEAVATTLGAPVTLTWETAAEFDNVGFHIHRAVFSKANNWIPGERLNATIIPAEGTPTQGAAYSFVDTLPLQADEQRGYLLFDVDTHGATSFHGPALLSASEVGHARVPDWMIFR